MGPRFLQKCMIFFIAFCRVDVMRVFRGCGGYILPEILERENWGFQGGRGFPKNLDYEAELTALPHKPLNVSPP